MYFFILFYNSNFSSPVEFQVWIYVFFIITTLLLIAEFNKYVYLIPWEQKNRNGIHVVGL